MQWLAESPGEVVVAMRLKKLNTRKENVFEIPQKVEGAVKLLSTL